MGEWVQCSVAKYQKIKRLLPLLQERAFDDAGRRGWCLAFNGEVVARWTSTGLVNLVTVRVR